MAILLIAAAVAASLPQAPSDTSKASDPVPSAVRTSNSAVILPYAIDSDSPADMDLADLVEGEATDRAAPGPFGRRSPAQQASDEDLDQAFEEAADMARFGGPN